MIVKCVATQYMEIVR